MAAYTATVDDVVAADCLRVTVGGGLPVVPSGLLRVAGVATADRSLIGGLVWWAGVAFTLAWLDADGAISGESVEMDAGQRVVGSVQRVSDGADLATDLAAAGLGLPERVRYEPIAGRRYPIPVWPVPGSYGTCPATGGWAGQNLAVKIRGYTGSFAALNGDYAAAKTGVQTWFGSASGGRQVTIDCAGGRMQCGNYSGTLAGYTFVLPLAADFDPRGMYGVSEGQWTAGKGFATAIVTSQ